MGFNAFSGFNGTGAQDNTAIGFLALTTNTGSPSFLGSNYGNQNVAVGAYALMSLNPPNVGVALGNDNTAVGWSALQNFNPASGWSPDPNTAVGSQALMDVDTGRRNTAEGYQALTSLKGGYNNTAVGHQSLQFLNDVGKQNTAEGTFSLQNDSANNNTAVGYSAMQDNTQGYNNTAIGFTALQGGPNTGWFNVAVGSGALHQNQTGISNSATGTSSENSNIGGSGNVANGDEALYTNKVGNNNVAIGNGSLYYDTVSNNTATGAASGYNITKGTYNTADGYYSLYGNTANVTGDSNAGVGAYSLYNLIAGHANAALGFKAGASTFTTNDYDNLFLGTFADKSPIGNPIHNSAAIGTQAQVSANNQMELGNNNVTITAGCSGHPPTGSPNAVTRLELNTEYGSTPFNVTAGTTPPLYVNRARGTGWSGLRFDDLTDASTPGINPGLGVLSVDSMGNVIYVQDTLNKNNGGIGYCAPTGTGLTPMLGDGGYNLNDSNFYFAGNAAGIHDNNVIIGNSCGYVPKAKLDVFQNSGTTSAPSVGIYVENDDLPPCSVSTTQPPVIGIKSYIPGNYLMPNISKVAGWFEADGSPNCCTASGPQYAIYVPQNGGGVALGYVWNTTSTTSPNQWCSTGYQLDVNGTVAFVHARHLSDSSVKNTITPLSNALSVINNLKGVSYYLDSAYQVDTCAKGIQYGFIAKQVNRVIPNIVSKSHGLCSMDYEEIIPWAVEALKQEKQTNDSLRYTLDSLRSAFQSYTSCLQRLCGHAPVHHNGGNDSNSTISNTQDVMLSDANAPLLYQNTPNPFKSGTKINYYLPENVQGAEILFYDSYGNQLKTVQISQTGNGTLNVTPDNLSAGIYSYSLVVNGKVVDTKRMILQK